MAPENWRDDVLSGIYTVLVRNTCQHSQQTRPTTQSWTNAGPSSEMLAQNQTQNQWFNASCLLGCVQPSEHETFVHCWTNVEDVVQMLYKCFVFAGNSSCPGNTIHWANAGFMLGRPRRRLANINSALDKCIVFAGWSGIACRLLLAAITSRYQPSIC